MVSLGSFQSFGSSLHLFVASSVAAVLAENTVVRSAVVAMDHTGGAPADEAKQLVGADSSDL